MKKSKMINVVQVVCEHQQISLREIVINSAHIISMVGDPEMAAKHASGKLPTGLHEAQEFSRIKLANGDTISVIGSPNLIKDKTKNLLLG